MDLCKLQATFEILPLELEAFFCCPTKLLGMGLSLLVTLSHHSDVSIGWIGWISQLAYGLFRLFRLSGLLGSLGYKIHRQSKIS